MVKTPTIACLRIPTPFPIGPVNAYLIEGDPLTLVDAGPRSEDAWGALTAGLAEVGYRLPDIACVVVTHAHLDHYGLARRVVDESGAEVYAHPRSLNWLRDTPGEWQRRTEFFGAFLREAGVPKEMLARLQVGMAAGARWAESLPPSVPLKAIAEGDVVRLGGATWHVLDTPGHSPSHLCLYDPTAGTLIGGDVLLPRVSSNPLLEPAATLEGRTRSLPDYLRTLERLATLDVTLVWPGHGDRVDDHRTLIARRLEQHGERLGRVVALLRDGPKAPYAISQVLFPDLPPGQIFLAICEVVGHLDVLEDQGRVRRTRGGDLVSYELTD